MDKPTNIVKETLLFYWRHAWRYPRKVWAILLFLPATLFFHQFLPPLIAANVIDKLSAGGFSPDRLWQDFGSELTLFAVSSLLGGVVLWRIVIYFNWSLETLVIRDILRETFDHLMKLDTKFHANSFGGSLVSQTNKLAGAYARIADTFQFNLYTLVISLVLTSVVLWDKSPAFVASLWAIAVLYTLLMFRISRLTRKRTAAEARIQNRVTGYLADAVTNVLAVKSFAGDKQESGRFATATEKLRHASLGVMWAATRQELASSAITGLLYVASLFIAVISVVKFSAEVSTVFLLLAYATNIAQRLWDLGNSAFRNLNRGLGDAQDGILTLRTEPTVQDPPHPEKAIFKDGAITFRNVQFTHDGNNGPLFKSFKLEVKAGEKIGLVGHSGSGKTSLTRLLLRYADIDSGEILVGGQNIAHVTQNDLRQAISYVPQEPLLFHRSIRENIAYGKPDAPAKEVAAIARQAHAHEFIEQLPDDYDTLVGERGVKLSGGQRQRVAIARAMLKNAPILVLDEATSALDSESEVLIQDALWKLMEGRTAIVIAHRLSTIQKMDRIIVLDKGRIIEQGTHRELIKQNGTYATLWSHQSGGFIEE